jgi:hypothetical protein
MKRFYLTWDNAAWEGSVEGYLDDQIRSSQNPDGVTYQQMGGPFQTVIKVFDNYEEATAYLADMQRRR